MNKKWTKKDFVLGLVAFALCVLIFSIQSTKSLYEKRNSYLVPPQSIKYMTFGYEDVLADSLWIRLIQDFSTCDPSGKAGVQEYLRQDLRSEELDESLKDADSEKLYELYEEKWKAPKCHMSWVYYMLDRITDLSPKFDRAYRTGGLFLSIVLDDRVGGELFYDKALKDHPNNWQLAYHAGYHALYETRKFS
ncbi:MAG: hypothetical protein CL677_04430, partial [Bdellovibrionaceae bacterium]|nr:hypothetical protein [Pseudobdellovibrionaceae bacterium]